MAYEHLNYAYMILKNVKNIKNIAVLHWYVYSILYCHVLKLAHCFLH